jgi:hypothetical protein
MPSITKGAYMTDVNTFRIARIPEPWRTRANKARSAYHQTMNENFNAAGPTPAARMELERFYLRSMMIAIEDGESVIPVEDDYDKTLRLVTEQMDVP